MAKPSEGGPSGEVHSTFLTAAAAVNDMKDIKTGMVIGSGDSVTTINSWDEKKYPQKDGYRYTCGRLIGKGAFGRVYKSFDHATKAIVAIKIMSTHELDGISGCLLREIDTLNSCDHPGIVKLLECANIHSSDSCKLFDDKTRVTTVDETSIYRCPEPVLVFPLMKSDLHSYLNKQNRSVHPDQIRRWMFQLLHALNYLREKNIMHRDLKPQNLLLDDENNLKIGDMGLSRYESIPVSGNCVEVVTIWYRSVELLGTDATESRYTPAIDMWSVGCIFGEMCQRKALFQGDTVKNQLHSIFRYLGVPTTTDWPQSTEYKRLKSFQRTFVPNPTDKLMNINDFPGLNPDGYDLLKLCLMFDPKKRITPKAALAHAYFDPIRNQMLAEYALNNPLPIVDTDPNDVKNPKSPESDVSKNSSTKTKSVASSSSSSLTSLTSPISATVSLPNCQPFTSMINSSNNNSPMNLIHGMNSNLVYIPPSLYVNNNSHPPNK